MAGSGISPSAHQQGNEVDLADPQTSLPDPHFPADSKVPSSVAGSGISPSVKYLESNDKISNAEEEHLPADIKTILESILSFDSGPQLPFSLTQIQNEDYYFLQQPIDISGRTKDHASVKPVGNQAWQNQPFEIDIIKKDFPILQERVNGRQIIWLDNAATTQKPNRLSTGSVIFTNMKIRMCTGRHMNSLPVRQMLMRGKRESKKFSKCQICK